MSLSIIIPAHNEEHRLAPTLLQYNQFMRKRFGDSFELIVVANGCTDSTIVVAAEIASTIPQVKVIDIQEAVGKGGAILEGFRRAVGHTIVLADADGATTPSSLINLIDQLDRYDVVIGSRWLSTSRVTRQQPLKRRLLSRLFNLCVRLLFNIPYLDTQCGAKAFRADAAKKLASVIIEKHWMFDVDLLLWAEVLNLTVSEHPVTWADQPGSTLRIRSTIYQVVQSLWRMKYRHTKRTAEALATPLIEVQR